MRGLHPSPMQPASNPVRRPLWRLDRVGLAALSFAGQRVDYYEYLAELMEDSAGRRNLLDVFNADAQRYAGMPRGILSAHWAQRYEECGADLAAAWEGTVPSSELMVIRVAQSAGNAALSQALRDLARVVGLWERARSEFVGTVAVGVVGLSMALGVLAALPLMIVPSLRQAFSFVPQERWGSLARELVAFSAQIAAAGPVAVVLLLVLVAAVAWSLPAYVGRLRRWLDAHVVFHALYRDIRSALFVCTVASMIRCRPAAGGMGLQEALQRIAFHAEPWLRWHCERSIERILDHGAQGAEIFDTGVLADPAMHYLQDIVQARGFEEGLLKAGTRIEQRVLTRVRSRAQVLRWTLLLCGLGAVMAVGAWTMGVVFEMKQVAVGIVSGH